MTDPTPDPAPVPPARPDAGVTVAPLPQPATEEAARPHIFGAAAAGTVTATPGLTVAGVSVDTGPNSSLTDLVVLDGLAFTWGRQQVMDQPEPATASIALFDPSSSWAQSRDLIGQAVTLTYAGMKAGVQTVVPIFIGRITTAKLARKIVQKADGTQVIGQAVTLTASSILNDLANIVPAESWPAEALGARRARIETYARNAGVLANVAIRGYWVTPAVAPIDINSQVSILEHLIGLYNSCGPDRFTFLPWESQAIQLERRDYGTWRTAACLHWNVAGEGTARDGKGAYIWSLAQPAYDNGLSGVNLYLDAQALEYDDTAGLSRDITTRLTRVLLTHPDGSNNNTETTIVQLVSAIDPAVSESVIGIRSVAQSSITNNNSYAAQAASDLAYMADREAAGWRADPFTFRSSLNGGGFDYWDQLSQMLNGGETMSYWFLQRSWFAQVGIRPCFAIIGGTVTYTAGEWQQTCQIAPINTLPMPQHAIAWDEIDDGSATYQLQWWDDDNPRGLHESVTYEDIGFCGRGLNVNTAPPDSGFDRTYP